MLNWLIAAVVLYSGFVALLYMAQRSLQYFPERGRTAPWTVGLTEAEEVVLDITILAPAQWRRRNYLLQKIDTHGGSNEHRLRLMLSHRSTQNTAPSNDTFICSLPDCAFVVDRLADGPAFERPENYGYCACSGGQALGELE